jgi:H+-transporting ATPase
MSAQVSSPERPAPEPVIAAVAAGGLTGKEARERLSQHGPNSIADVEVGPIRRVLEKFSAPVPWLLEATVLLESLLGKYIEAAVILALLIFNAAIGFIQESRAQATLTALKSRLSLTAAVLRDGAWTAIPAAELVPGDVIKLSLGGVVAADVRICDGEVLLDQSMLTGESIPVEAGAGAQAYAGALIRRGEATAEVTATGQNTKFGNVAKLIVGAHVVSSQQSAVFRVVRNLAVCNGILILFMLAYAHWVDMRSAEVISLTLTAVLASIPVALPATFTLAAALGARALVKVGVLPTRLSAVDEAASMDVLCADKTGTLTLNQLEVTSIWPSDGSSRVLSLAAIASSEGGRDPVDTAIRESAVKANPGGEAKQTSFLPFDPATKRSEGTYSLPDGPTQRVVKGAFSAVSLLVPTSVAANATAQSLEAKGFRVLAVAAGAPAELKLVGLIALSDPPRADSAAFIQELTRLGVRTVMLTGDARATASIVAQRIGLAGSVCPAGADLGGVVPQDFAIFAGILPEDKYKIVEAYQNEKHIVGMCGDGANDAPALRQAHLGIAVSSATEIAKAAAGIVLTTPGLGGIVATVQEGRLIFQRILTYTLNSITKKLAQVLFLGVGLIMTGHAIMTPLLMVMVMTIGDFLGMSLTTDRVRPSPLPNVWKIRNLTFAGLMMGAGELLFCSTIFAFGDFYLHLSLASLQSLAFVLIVFGNQATTYTNRERRHLWSSRPGKWVMIASGADIAVASILAVAGFAMHALPIFLVGGALAAAALFAVALDVLKVPVFRRLKIA